MARRIVTEGSRRANGSVGDAARCGGGRSAGCGPCRRRGRAAGGGWGRGARGAGDEQGEEEAENQRQSGEEGSFHADEYDRAESPVSSAALALADRVAERSHDSRPREAQQNGADDRKHSDGNRVDDDGVEDQRHSTPNAPFD